MRKEYMYPRPEELGKLRLEGVIEPAKLSPGTTIFVETVKHVYEFNISEDGITVTSSQSEIFQAGQHPCEIAGSIDNKGMLFAGMIVKGKHLVISLKKKGRFVSGLIKSASVHGKGWSYELWDSNS